ncbi:MAG: hypothetical protein D3924_07910 [Candidatus Electrothrix sp. AR4]|nr:hypothetical protein [Candidatus Electrothrix sp. AR4]
MNESLNNLLFDECQEKTDQTTNRSATRLLSKKLMNSIRSNAQGKSRIPGSGTVPALGGTTDFF